jgi:hypothetical protein
VAVFSQAGTMTVGRSGPHGTRKASSSQNLVWDVDVAATANSTCQLRVNGVLVGPVVTLPSGSTGVSAALAVEIADGARLQVQVLTVGPGGQLPVITVFY